MSKYVFAMILCCDVATGGEYTQRRPEYADDVWTECRTVEPPKIAIPPTGTLPDGTQWTYNQDANNIQLVRGDAYYGAGIAWTIKDIAGCNRLLGTWSWGLSRHGDTTNMSIWLRPSMLDRDINPWRGEDYIVDAADAAVLFKWWETPIGDITGDGSTDAADAGRLFEEWTGSSSPSAIPEPSGLCGLLLLIPALRHRCRTAPSK